MNIEPWRLCGNRCVPLDRRTTRNRPRRACVCCERGGRGRGSNSWESEPRWRGFEGLRRSWPGCSLKFKWGRSYNCCLKYSLLRASARYVVVIIEDVIIIIEPIAHPPTIFCGDVSIAGDDELVAVRVAERGEEGNFRKHVTFRSSRRTHQVRVGPERNVENSVPECNAIAQIIIIVMNINY